MGGNHKESLVVRTQDTEQPGPPPQEPPVGAKGHDPQREEALATRVDALVRALPRLAPASDFQARVLAHMRIRNLAWMRLHGQPTGSRRSILDPFDALLEGELSRRQARALAAFVAVDPEAGVALAERRRLAERLARVPSLGPRLGFADRVMARVSVAPPSLRRRLLARVRARATTLLPGRKERLAAVFGAAFGPAAAFGAAYAVLSDPLATVAGTAGFALAKVGTVLPPVARAAAGGAEGIVATAAAPVVAIGLTAFAVLAVLSGWILYRNLVKVVAPEQRHVPA